jgi:hypothetical protein
VNAQQAMDFMVEKGIDPDVAGWLANIAYAYGYVSIPSIWKGPDSWGSEIDFSISYYAHDPEHFRPEHFTVKFTERKLWLWNRMR